MYDPLRARILVYGGTDGISRFSDLLAFSPETVQWTHFSPSGGPGPRWGHTAVYDSGRDRMIVFGGYSEGSIRQDDVWALSLAGEPTWSQIVPEGPGPSARAFHSAVFEPSRDRMVVFGGLDAGILNDVWALELAPIPRWVQLAATGSPPSRRYSHTAIFDPLGDRMIVFGGLGSTFAIFNDVFQLSLGENPNWNRLSPTGAKPSARRKHTAVYDSSHRAMVVFGGNASSGFAAWSNELWSLSLDGELAWTQLQPIGTLPLPREGHGAAYVPTLQRMWMFGGVNRGWLEDAWDVSLSGTIEWRQLQPPPPPLPFPGFVERWGHSTVYDPPRDRLILYGGTQSDQGAPFGQLWELSLGAPFWRERPPEGQPPSPRFVHTAVLDAKRDRMIVFGGYDGAFLNDVWALELATTRWTRLQPAGPSPRRRDAHSAIYDPVRDRMLVLGGYDGAEALSDLWSLTFAPSEQWTLLSPSGEAPSPRFSHSAIYDPLRDAMIVFGGARGGSVLNEIWSLSLSDLGWTHVVPGGLSLGPGGRSGHAMSYDSIHGRALVFGGYDLEGWHNDVWILWLDRVIPEWEMLSPTGNRPVGRMYTGFVNDPGRDRMILVGGWTGDHPTNDTWELILDRPVAAPLSIVSAKAEAGVAQLIWYVSTGPGVMVGIERREPTTDWGWAGQATSDAEGWIVFEDRHVSPCGRYGYRANLDGRFFGEAWVDVPAAGQFALEGFQPNPSSSRPSIVFALPTSEPARLAIFDPSGREIWSRDVGPLGSGAHRLQWENAFPLSPGLYVVRLTQGMRTISAKAVVLH